MPTREGRIYRARTSLMMVLGGRKVYIAQGKLVRLPDGHPLLTVKAGRRPALESVEEAISFDLCPPEARLGATETATNDPKRPRGLEDFHVGFGWYDIPGHGKMRKADARRALGIED